MLPQPYASQIYQDYAIRQCPDNPGKILSDCGDNVNIIKTFIRLAKSF